MKLRLESSLWMPCKGMAINIWELSARNGQ
jgi:hypothetical protein